MGRIIKKDEVTGIEKPIYIDDVTTEEIIIDEENKALNEITNPTEDFEMDYAEEYAKKNNLKVIYNKKSPAFILHNSPKDFLSWIYYAENVFTNSFHGTMLSVIFGKKLAAQTTLLNGKENSRVAELLRSTGLEQCVLSADNADGGCADADDFIAQMRQNGLEYLKSVCKL